MFWPSEIGVLSIRNIFIYLLFINCLKVYNNMYILYVKAVYVYAAFNKFEQ